MSGISYVVSSFLLYADHAAMGLVTILSPPPQSPQTALADEDVHNHEDLTAEDMMAHHNT